MPNRGLPTEEEIVAAAKLYGYFDSLTGTYPIDKRRRLMNLALALRKSKSDLGEQIGKQAAADVLEQDMHGTTVERLHDFYQDAQIQFGEERAFLLTLAVAPALVTRSGLHTDSEGTAPDDDATAQEDHPDGEDGTAGTRPY